MLNTSLTFIVHYSYKTVSFHILITGSPSTSLAIVITTSSAHHCNHHHITPSQCASPSWSLTISITIIIDIYIHHHHQHPPHHYPSLSPSPSLSLSLSFSHVNRRDSEQPRGEQQPRRRRRRRWRRRHGRRGGQRRHAPGHLSERKNKEGVASPSLFLSSLSFSTAVPQRPRRALDVSVLLHFWDPLDLKTFVYVYLPFFFLSLSLCISFGVYFISSSRTSLKVSNRLRGVPFFILFTPLLEGRPENQKWKKMKLRW